MSILCVRLTLTSCVDVVGGVVCVCDLFSYENVLLKISLNERYERKEQSEQERK